MSRPKIKKMVCAMPRCKEFHAVSDGDKLSCVLTIEEYEVIRLIDLVDMSQEECARQMKVSRPTVQILYSVARRKIADFIVNGKDMVINGGEYILCDDLDTECMHREKIDKCKNE